MIFTYHRVGRISVVGALAAAGAVVVVGGIAATVLAIVGVAAVGAGLLRAFGRIVAPRREAAIDDGRIIEGVVVESSTQERSQLADSTHPENRS